MLACGCKVTRRGDRNWGCRHVWDPGWLAGCDQKRGHELGLRASVGSRLVSWVLGSDCISHDYAASDVFLSTWFTGHEVL